MADADPLYAAVSDLSALRLDWPAVIMSGMTQHQLKMEQLRHKCKKRYRGTLAGLCTFCGKVIRLDLASYGDVQFPGVLYGRERHRTVSITFGWLMQCPLRSKQEVGSHHGQSPGISGAKPYNHLSLEC